MRGSRVTPAALLAVGLAFAATPHADAAASRQCAPVNDVPELEGSRYEGADIVRIRALRVRCSAARRLARKATLKGMRLGAATDTHVYGFVWLVERDLRGDTDRYLATKIADVRTTQVRWRFR